MHDSKYANLNICFHYYISQWNRVNNTIVGNHGKVKKRKYEAQIAGFHFLTEQLLKETRHSMAGAFIVTAEENFLTFEWAKELYFESVFSERHSHLPHADFNPGRPCSKAEFLLLKNRAGHCQKQLAFCKELLKVCIISQRPHTIIVGKFLGK